MVYKISKKSQALVRIFGPQYQNPANRHLALFIAESGFGTEIMSCLQLGLLQNGGSKRLSNA